MKKINILLFVLTIFASNVNAQFKLQSNGEACLWTNNTGPWDNPMTIFPNHDLSKCYRVYKDGDKFFVRGDGYIFARGSYINSDINLKKDIKNVESIDNLFLLQAKCKIR